MRVRTVLAIAVLVSLLAACGGGDDVTGTTDPDTPVTDTTGDTPTSTTTPPAVSGDVMVTIAYQGGFVPVEVAVNGGPYHVLTRDGSLISEGPLPEIFPPPLVRPYRVVDVSADMEALEEIIDRMGIADVVDETIEGDGLIADAPATVVTYHDESGAHRISAQALMAEPRPDDPRLVAILDLVMTLDSFASEGDSRPYPVERWQVLLSAPMETGDIVADPLPWPLPVAPGDFEGDISGFPCTVVDNDPDLDATFAQASQFTTWTADGEEHSLLVRPLLPGEEGCQGP